MLKHCYTDDSHGSKAFSSICVCVCVFVCPHNETRTDESKIPDLAQGSTVIWATDTWATCWATSHLGDRHSLTNFAAIFLTRVLWHMLDREIFHVSPDKIISITIHLQAFAMRLYAACIALNTFCDAMTATNQTGITNA